MIGDTIIYGGEEFEVVWAGGEGLIPDRLTKPGQFWQAPPRMYNKRSAYWTTPKPVTPVVQVVDGGIAHVEVDHDDQVV